MNKIKKLLEDLPEHLIPVAGVLVGFNATLDRPWTKVQIASHAEGLAGADVELLRKATHKAYDNSHEYFQGKPSVEQLRRLMDTIWQEDNEKRKDKELADGREQAKIMRDAASSAEHKDTATKCLALLGQRMDGKIGQGEFEARVKETTE
ncbi:hypothetical protein LCGC14_0338350 [marine sediment metagenome]|uniref:Uncharacterized protein n=1 Tax=marine sediment metagenome TaxID=412755 RepID=A0A0F9W1S5_9ZZZZ